MAASISVLPLAKSTFRYHKSIRTSTVVLISASHQLRHAPSRQRRKLKWSAMVVCSLRRLDVEHLLGNGGVHFAPAA